MPFYARKHSPGISQKGPEDWNLRACVGAASPCRHSGHSAWRKTNNGVLPQYPEGMSKGQLHATSLTGRGPRAQKVRAFAQREVSGTMVRVGQASRGTNG